MKMTSNPKNSLEKFTKLELEMIKKIKKSGYKIKFYYKNKGAIVYEPCMSLTTGKILKVERFYATTIKNWNCKNKKIYPLEKWFNILVKKHERRKKI